MYLRYSVALNFIQIFPVKENKTEQPSHNEAQQENPSAESKKATPPLSKRGERFRNEFLSRIVPWEKIAVSFDNFPYYIE